MVQAANSKPFFLTRWDNSLENFFSKANPVTKPANKTLLNRASYYGKSTSQNAGFRLNKYTYKAANAIGKKMMSASGAAEAAIKAGSKPGLWGKLVLKSKMLTNLGNGLSKLGTKAGGKIPGMATLFGLITGGIGVFKAAKCALKGNWKEAGYELIKTTGSVAGVMASMVVFVPGVNIFAALAMAMGLGFAGDWTGKKLADIVFPSVGRKQAAKEELQKMNAIMQQRLKMYG
ncbi:MAG: hypothetical protein AB1782_07980 [Cyanobacteriota bacterium]